MEQLFRKRKSLYHDDSDEGQREIYIYLMKTLTATVMIQHTETWPTLSKNRKENCIKGMKVNKFTSVENVRTVLC